MTRDERAFLDHLAKTHQDAMVWLTYRRTGDSQLARDLVQETFLLACCKIHILRRHKNPAQEISDRRGFTEAACRKQVSRLIQKCRQLLDEGVKNF